MRSVKAAQSADADDTFVRIPREIAEPIRELAGGTPTKNRDLFGAALLAMAILASAFVEGRRSPSIAALIRHIEEADPETNVVFGTFEAEEWSTLKPIIDRFNQLGLITPLRTKQATGAISAFNFHLTRKGGLMLRLASRMLSGSMAVAERDGRLQVAAR